MVEQYIKVYEWILRHPELSRIEALLVCEILRWPEGCYKSAQSLADLLRSDKRTIQRLIRSLRKRGWVTILPETTDKHLRILYATPKEPPLGPLFEYTQKAESARAEKRKKAVDTLVKKAADGLYAG
jgi:hypothetical protein